MLRTEDGDSSVVNLEVIIRQYVVLFAEVLI